MKFLEEIGEYFYFMLKVFSKPQKHSVFFKQWALELYKVGVDSIGIVVIISFFMGAVLALQAAYNMTNPLMPTYLIGYGTRESMLLEFSSTIVSLILAGKVGSSIASEIGTMRSTEQIDALDVMGINSANYLALPKIMASLTINPILYILSVFVGITGGLLSSVTIGVSSLQDFIYGIRMDFKPYFIVYSEIKMVVFAFIITSLASYYGYTVRGGSLEVGRASTKAVVNSSILILISNLVLTQILL
ncbi:phospholipid/cholesterol/gamma-HCH transport system permease protein [Balneicella halophila]|uniref:Phospholipid/cholesterol/gamma-HCH transport system permease protein n=1 Tax=Balneicella halophila TaxID=1537566 RepID=A0A7L4UQM8_BALHA|nr:ABC transporter permease [Balneicella halophila]PVX50902.1 phospholipid/cholesterol/gamma-HCH transport system permease protein [Balneicella halophila]